jgi:hypothetical protein
MKNYTKGCIAILCILIAIACGGKTTNNGVLMSKVKGQIDLDLAKQKAYLATKPITATAFDLDNPNIFWPCTINGNDFSFEMVRRSNAVLKVYMNGEVILSKILAREDTDFAVVDEVKVNTVTHIHSLMTQRKQQSKTNEWSYQTSIKEMYSELMDLTTPTNEQLSIDNLNAKNPIIAAIASTYSQIFSAENLANLKDTLALFEKTFSHSELKSVESGYLLFVNLANVDVAEAVASLHEVAKNSKKINFEYFNNLNDRFTNSTIIAAIEKFKEAPTFNTDIDSVRIAAPGTLFQYNFPDATTTDILGVSEYIGEWIENTTPSGAYDDTNNNNKILKWIPSEFDMNKTFKYQLKAIGTNGKTSVQPKVIEIAVKNLEIIPDELKELPNQPVFGPISFGDYAYLVSAYSGQANLMIEKYLLSDFAASGTKSKLNPITWSIPYGVVNDAKIYNNHLYIATQNSPIHAYDALFESDTSASPTYIGNVKASQMEFIGTNLYSILDSSPLDSKVTTLDLRETVTSEPLADIEPNSSSQLGQINSSFLYLTKNNTAVIFQEGASSLDELARIRTTASNKLAKSSFDSIQDEYLYSQTAVQFLKVSSTKISTRTFSPLLIRSFAGITSNGSYIFSADNTVNRILGYSVNGNIIIESTDTSKKISYDHVPSKVRFLVQNLPEGIGGQTSSYLYSLGTGLSSTISPTWYLKRHKLKPQD